MYLIAGRPPEHVAPEPLCDGPPCPPLDPESLCASGRISRTASALALPGFGYTPDFASLDTQPSSPRYVRLQPERGNDWGCNDLGLNSGLTRYDSLPSVSRKQLLLPEAAKPAVLPDAEGPLLIRVVSEPNMPTLLKGAQLQSSPSGTPQSWAWGLTPLYSSPPAVDENAATSAFGGPDSTSPVAAFNPVDMPGQTAASIPSEVLQTDMHSELSQHAGDLSSTSAGTAPLLGYVAPRTFQLPPRLVIDNPSDSYDVPKSDLQPETGQTAASS